MNKMTSYWLQENYLQIMFLTKKKNQKTCIEKTQEPSKLHSKEMNNVKKQMAKVQQKCLRKGYIDNK